MSNVPLVRVERPKSYYSRERRTRPHRPKIEVTPIEALAPYSLVAYLILMLASILVPAMAFLP
jgi:hypothetical protein